MITSDAWGYKNNITKENVCVGTIRNQEDTKTNGI